MFYALDRLSPSGLPLSLGPPCCSDADEATGRAPWRGAARPAASFYRLGFPAGPSAQGAGLPPRAAGIALEQARKRARQGETSAGRATPNNRQNDATVAREADTHVATGQYLQL